MLFQLEVTTHCTFTCFYCAGREMPQRHMGWAVFEMVLGRIAPGPHTVSLAQDKAYTALTLASRFATSQAFANARNSTLGSPMSNVRGVTGVGGGVPIKYRGETIGAVGSSGAVGGTNDEICSQAGIDAVAADLK